MRRVGTLSYRGDGWNAQLLARGYQSLLQNAARHYSSLPQLTVNVRETISFLDLRVRGRYTSFHKDNDAITGPLAIVGQRLVLDTTITSRFTNSWGYLVPSAGAIYRAYQLQDTPASARTAPHMTIPFVTLDTGLIFDRFFTFKNVALQQTLEPRAYFLYVSDEPQNDLPIFDAAAATPSFSTLFRRNRFSGYDRIGDARQVSIGLTSSILSASSGGEFAKVSIGRIVYFDDRKVIFRPGRAADPTASSSAFFTEARLRLGGNFSLSSLFEWDSKHSRANRGKFFLRYRDPKFRRILNINYSYTNPDVQPLSRFQNSKESDLSFIWPIKGKWSAIGRWNFGWDNDQTIESLVGVEYNDCCWKTRLAFRRFLEDPRLIPVVIDDPITGGTRVVRIPRFRADTGVFFEFQLKGLSTLGKRLDSMLEDSIPGYRRREDQIGL